MTRQGYVPQLYLQGVLNDDGAVMQCYSVHAAVVGNTKLRRPAVALFSASDLNCVCC